MMQSFSTDIYSKFAFIYVIIYIIISYYIIYILLISHYQILISFEFIGVNRHAAYSVHSAYYYAILPSIVFASVKLALVGLLPQLKERTPFFPFPATYSMSFSAKSGVGSMSLLVGLALFQYLWVSTTLSGVVIGSSLGRAVDSARRGKLGSFTYAGLNLAYRVKTYVTFTTVTSAGY